jgi:hypothetical protein
MLSKNGIGLIVLVLSLIGVDVAEDALVTTVSTIGQIIGGLLMVLNQVQRPDTKYFIFKK